MSRFGSFNVLIVEDDAIAQMTLKIMLNEMGFKQTFISNSQEDALTIIQASNIDMVLLDVFIDGNPVGIDLARELNKVSEAPILFLTGSTDLETLEGMKRSKNHGVLEKPYDYERIETRLSQILSLEE